MPLSEQLKLYQVWRDPEDDSLTVSTEDGIARLREQNLLSASAVFLYPITAASYEEASAIYYLRQGWHPYRPMGNAELCPRGCGSHFYPGGSGECPFCGKIA